MSGVVEHSRYGPVIDTARLVCGAGSMKRSSVRPSVRLPICPIIRPQPQRAAGLLLSTVREEDIDRQT